MAATGWASADTFYTLSTPSPHRTLIIHFEEIHQPFNVIVHSETHSITMDPEGTTATIELKRDDVSASEKLALVESGVVCIDFIPKVFGSFQVLYAVAADRVALFIHPFAADVHPLERVVVRFEEGMFEDDFRGRRRIDTGERKAVAEDGSSGVDVFYAALARLFGSGKSVRWGPEQILPLREKKEPEDSEE